MNEVAHKIPICPKCNIGTKRIFLRSEKTCIGWLPCYNENGYLMNNDPNVTTDVYYCGKCETEFEVKH